MLGLKKGMVILSDYQPEWRELYELEREFILGKIGDFILDIQHVGSTAVPGLRSKPILDIAIQVRSRIETNKCAEVLSKNGFIDRGETGGQGGYLLVKEVSPQFRTHHVHVVTEDDPQWMEYLALRHWLRENENLREQYAQLKAVLQERHANDRSQYTKGKSDFIRMVLRKD
jgi:GrpB-like predicted nucleotidyltransferase (UPF0157 family)